MARMIKAERLKLMRERRDLSQKGLAAKARLNKQTIYRREREDGPMRDANLERMARALDVGPEVLTGEKPIPAGISQPRAGGEEASYQFNVRLHPAVRNAFELAARRYGVSVSKIAQLAPLLFVILAEASLKERRRRLDELVKAVSDASERFSELFKKMHHVVEIQCSGSLNGELRDPEIDFDIEEKSIEKRDLFGEEEWASGHGPSDSDNPFANYLKELAAARDDIKIRALGPTSTRYEVCPLEAMELAKNDDELVRSVLNGEVLIHEIPRGLKTDEERLEWMRRPENKKPVREVPEEKPGELPGDLDLSDLPDLVP